MVTLNATGRAGRCIALVAALMLVGWAAGAAAQQENVAAADLPGGYVVLPKVVVHTTGGNPPVGMGGQAYDTVIQITNVDQDSSVKVDCWWVNANSRCGGDGDVCQTNADCPAGLNCEPQWSVLDFTFTLTPGQPIGFTAAGGLFPVPCDNNNPNGNCAEITTGGNILRVPEDPFMGELKCVAVDADDVPLNESPLKIEATIVSTTVPGGLQPLPPSTTAASYNGIGFAAVEAGSGDPDDPLCLGSAPQGSTLTCGQTYTPCPGVLILNHFFDGATPDTGGIVSTDLTLVPCSENLGNPDLQANFEVVAQMLVYNEFEQRFSTFARVECYRATPLVDIDTIRGPAGDQFSVFSIGVEGTLTGQTRIRGVQGPNGDLGYGLLGVACENYRGEPGGPVLATSAFNLHHTGIRPTGAGDVVVLTDFPNPVPPPP